MPRTKMGAAARGLRSFRGSDRRLKRSLRIIEYSGGNHGGCPALAQDPSVVIFEEPTGGVDVGVIPQIHAAIRELTARRKVLAISNRILVARRGRIVEALPVSTATVEKIMYEAIH
jgi:ABC-type sugar transport system ATPase subunit